MKRHGGAILRVMLVLSVLTLAVSAGFLIHAMRVFAQEPYLAQGPRDIVELETHVRALEISNAIAREQIADLRSAYQSIVKGTWTAVGAIAMNVLISVLNLMGRGITIRRHDPGKPE